MNTDCLFCKIINGQEKSWKIWENDHCVAFLTPYPNTPGFTVIATKEHVDSNVLSLPQEEFVEIVLAGKEVSNILQKAFKTSRNGLIIEGMGIDHAHIKIIPMHGIKEGPWEAIKSNLPLFKEKYEGYLTSQDGPRMSDEDIYSVQQSILNSINDRIKEA